MSNYDLNNLTNLQLIGIVLYKNFIYPFFLESIVLLISMFGAIVLTSTNQKKNKKQDFYIQNTRNVFSSIRKLT